MARNRKRAKERRARRPQPVVGARAEREDAAPGPMSHAAPDVELAEAQLALGRPDLATSEAEREPAEELEAELEAEAEASIEAEAGNGGAGGSLGGGGFGGGGAGGDRGSLGGGSGGGGGELAVPGAAAPEHRTHTGNRLINFLQGSWRELQRVQWPDRRQVMQATGVVIGFVIVAGVFLGVADFLAQKLVNYMLK